MAMLFYIGSLITNVFNLILIIILTFADEDAKIHKFFGDKEIYICVFLAFAFMVVGHLLDNKGRGF